MANQMETLRKINIIRETDNAILIEYKENEYWFPLSQVESIKRSTVPEQSEIVVAGWLLKQKGLA